LVLLPFFLSSGFRQQGTAAALRFTILFGPVLLLAVALIPLSIALAILKYRLWDISFVVRRTLVYGLLSIVLALIYFGSVIVLQRLFSAVSRQQSPIVIVVSTLIIAGLFSPLRGKIQEMIDRRFDRQKYDAALALDRFAKIARDEVDLNRLSAELINVVQEAIQPEHASLWLADTDLHNQSKQRRS
ncbi:MAG: hypothetical protein R3293_28965, partial [Candidatus Promineifilaceae bacterium]|nr:hypothetical protein [Candidatus Promineifilaceae bacterium]